MVTVMPESAQAEPTRLLWWSAGVSEAKANSTDRRVLARILDGVDGGGSHAVTYEFATLWPDAADWPFQRPMARVRRSGALMSGMSR
jgi:hypothetical protein